MPPTRQSPLILYLIMILGFVAGFLYNGQADPTAVVPPLSPKLQATALKGLETVRVDYSVLAQPQFQELRIFGQLPVQPGVGGKSDPFQ
jgi:hypothetical protein